MVKSLRKRFIRRMPGGMKRFLLFFCWKLRFAKENIAGMFRRDDCCKGQAECTQFIDLRRKQFFHDALLSVPHEHISCEHIVIEIFAKRLPKRLFFYKVTFSIT